MRSWRSGSAEDPKDSDSCVDFHWHCFSKLIRLYKHPRTDAHVEEIKRHFGVVAEALRSDIRQIAEGHSGIRHELQEIRDEFRDEFKEMRALMRLSFSQLDQRIRTLETDISTLKTRMDRLETHRA
jgi:predicted nuclease with TOPRIM domain